MSPAKPHLVRARTSLPETGSVDTGGATDWQTYRRKRERRRQHRWRAFMWSLVYPYRGNRLLLTLPGIIVMGVAMGLGLAAYNTNNNILFIALSLLLACLVCSAALSWLNLRKLSWRLRVQPPLRAGRDHPVVIELHNKNRVMPVYGVWFDLNATGEKRPARLPLRERLDPQGTTLLEWTYRPAVRGKATVELLGAGSLFPFGFLKKLVGSELRREVLVWPAPVQYQRFSLISRHQPGHDERASRAGQGGDLFALRAYARGDSNRLVHWKASARLQKLMVRQHAAETQTGFAMWVTTSSAEWTRAEQFEVMCGLAATMAEDLFRAGRLISVAFDDEAPMPVRRMHDLEYFLDRLALVKPEARSYQPPAGAPSVRRANLLTFAPDGARGVIAYVDGEKAASA